MASSPVSTDSIREAVGNSSASKRLHDSRNGTNQVTTTDTNSNSGGVEQFTADCRLYRSWSNKSIVLAGLQGCSMAAASLALMHATAKSTNHHVVGTLCKAAVISALPTGLALAFTSCSGIFHERRFQELERNREEWEMQNYVDGEREEMIQLYNARGISVKDATTIVDILLKDEKVFLDMMMMEELGYSRHPLPNSAETCYNVGLPICVAFTLSFIIPHLPKLLLAKKCSGGSNCGKNITNAVVAGEVVLACQTVALSILQSRLLLGVYTDTVSTAKATLTNGSWIVGTFALTSLIFKATSKLCRCK